MKHLFTFLIFTPVLADAQISLEHSYSNAWKTDVVNLDADGYKYVSVDDASKKVLFFNADHSLWKTVNTGIPLSASILYTLPTYASKGLFDNDSKIEFVVAYSTGSGYILSVFNEDGNTLTTINNTFSYEVRKVDNNWKLLVLKSNTTPMHTEVYGLPGQYVGILKPNADNNPVGVIYPNPMDNSATIRYNLPPGITEGKIEILDVRGQVVRTYNVTNQFTDVIVRKENLQSGNYLYRVTYAGGVSDAKLFTID